MYLYMNGDKWQVTNLVTSLADVRVMDIAACCPHLHTNLSCECRASFSDSNGLL